MTDQHAERLAPLAKSGGPVSAVRVLNGGRGEQHKEHRYGSRMPRLWWVFFSNEWVPLPLHFFLIEHSGGLILFDTGIDPAIKTDKNYIKQAVGRFLLPWIFRLEISGKDRVDQVLEREGIAPGDIRLAVISHLHFDHVGGIAHIPQAELLVSAREWAILSDPHPERDWILREHIEIPGAKWHQISFQPVSDPALTDFEGAFDIMGDGSLVLLPTPGHTPGSMSLLIRQPGWDPILLVGDLTYETRLLEEDVLPGTGDKTALLASFAKVRRLKEKLPGLAIVASHDSSAEARIAKATGHQA